MATSRRVPLRIGVPGVSAPGVAELPDPPGVVKEGMSSFHDGRFNTRTGLKGAIGRAKARMDATSSMAIREPMVRRHQGFDRGAG